MSERSSMRGHAPSPVDVEPDVEPDMDQQDAATHIAQDRSHGQAGALGWAAGAIAVASLFLLLTNAQALNGWAVEQVPSETMVRVTGATEGWLAATERSRMATPRAWMHGMWKRAQAARFAGQDAAAKD